MNHTLSFFSSCVTAIAFTWYVRRFAAARKWIFLPDSDRHLHRQPIPRLGGMALLPAFCFSLGVLAFGSRFLHLKLGFSPATWLGLLGPALLIFSIGLYDDFRPLGPYPKIAVQVLSAVCLFAGGYRFSYFPVSLESAVLRTVLSLAATIFWVLLITNAFNLIDGVDGLAAGSALCSIAVVFVLSFITGSTFVSLTSLALAGSVLGFLRFNFFPASIFLGDSGSLLIGFLISALTLASNQKSANLTTAVIPVIACGLPVLETTISVLRRVLNRKPLFLPDREHIHHRLLAAGISQRSVTLVLYGVSIVFACVSLLLVNHAGRTTGLALLTAGIVCAVAFQRLSSAQACELQRVTQCTLVEKKVIAPNLGIRHCTEKLACCAGFHEIYVVLKETFEHSEFEAFELKFLVPGEGLAPPGSWSTHDGRAAYTWARSGRRNLSSRPPWKLSFQFPSANRWQQGSFAVFRRDPHSMLLMDINLLTSSFRLQLAQALDRAFNQSAVAVPAETNTQRIAASALA